MPRPVLGRRQGEGRAQRALARVATRKGTNSVPAARMAPRSPSRIRALSDCQPEAFKTLGPNRGRFKLVERKPSPAVNFARFESPAKGFNAIITKF
jgi:hypothetical protein